MAPLTATLAALALAITSCAAIASPPANNTCWNIDAKFEVTGDRPCGDPKNGHSACCTDGAYCMEGGLCYDGWAVYRSSCTDPTWSDPACSTVCRGSNQGGATILSPLHVVPNVFCCGLLGETNGTCFDNNGHEAPNGFSMNFAPTIIGFANASYGDLMPWVDRSPALSPSNNASTAQTSSSASAQQNTSTTTAQQQQQQQTGPTPAAVGAGVGVPLGLALLAALALALFQRRRIAALHARLAVAEGRAPAPPPATGHAGATAAGMLWDGARWVPGPPGYGYGYGHAHGHAQGFAEKPPSVPPKEKRREKRAEMSGFDRGRELAAGWVGQELPGNGVDGKFDRVT